MRPRFKNELAWEQAELLMQPAYIRIIDHIRKATETTSYQVSFTEVTEPYPSYQLCLKNQDQQLVYDIWDLCFQVCFVNFQGSHTPLESQEVEIDVELIDQSRGDVDWIKLDQKAKMIIEEIFRAK
jgi:hypothetical protein